MSQSVAPSRRHQLPRGRELTVDLAVFHAPVLDGDHVAWLGLEDEAIRYYEGAGQA